jgi:hypothetical protein
MSQKSNILKAFNTLFFQFLDDIISIYPDNEELPAARNSFETFKKANPTALIKAWLAFVYIPYRDFIEEGNIAYFLEKDYSRDLEDSPYKKNVMDFITNFRGQLKEMSHESQMHSVKYMQQLSKLAQMYQ